MSFKSEKLYLLGELPVQMNNNTAEPEVIYCMLINLYGSNMS